MLDQEPRQIVHPVYNRSTRENGPWCGRKCSVRMALALLPFPDAYILATAADSKWRTFFSADFQRHEPSNRSDPLPQHLQQDSASWRNRHMPLSWLPRPFVSISKLWIPVPAGQSQWHGSSNLTCTPPHSQESVNPNSNTTKSSPLGSMQPLQPMPKPEEPKASLSAAQSLLLLLAINAGARKRARTFLFSACES